MVLRFLINLYINGEANTKYKGTISASFNLSQGVRQRSILSPYFYNIYTESLIERIQQLEIGTHLPPNNNISIIVFADDIILLSPTLFQLQLMIDECVLFGQPNGIKFNSDSDKNKTQFVISGDSPLPDPHLILNGERIQPQTNLKHLGFTWSKQSNKLSLVKHKQDRIAEL